MRAIVTGQAGLDKGPYLDTVDQAARTVGDGRPYRDHSCPSPMDLLVRPYARSRRRRYARPRNASGGTPQYLPHPADACPAW